MFSPIPPHRLAVEIKEMLESFHNVVLLPPPVVEPVWYGFVKKGRNKHYFLIRYPPNFPSWRPAFYPLDGPLEEGQFRFADPGLHTFYGKGLCLYTHDGGPDSWNETLTAADCVNRYIDFLNDKRSGILDYQDLYDRLTMPGSRSMKKHYLITQEGYLKLKELKKGTFKTRLIRKAPELHLISEITGENGVRLEIDHSWFNNSSIWEDLEHSKQGCFLEANYKEVQPDWTKNTLNNLLDNTNLPEDRELIIFTPQLKQLLPVIFETEPELRNYELQIFDSNQLFNRIKGILGPEIQLMKKQRVLLVGLGSIGSKIALTLARAGIGKLVLYDPDILELENIIRHTGNIIHLYQPKVGVIASQINQINPDAIIESRQASPFGEGEIYTFRVHLKASDLVICSVAIHEIEEAINREAIRARIPVIYSAALGNASFGRIFRVIPFKTACFNCFDLNNQENPEIYPTLSESTGTDVPRREGYREPGIPGIGFDIDVIANLAARMAFQTLLEINNIESSYYPETEGDHLIWSNQRGWIFHRSLEPIWFHHPKNPNCTICQKQVKEDTDPYEEVQELIRKARNPKRFKKMVR